MATNAAALPGLGPELLPIEWLDEKVGTFRITLKEIRVAFASQGISYLALSQALMTFFEVP